MKRVEFALEYGKRGMYVFPLKVNAKTPLTRHGFKDASIDQEQIRTWWKEYPNANIGIATGQSNLTVLDIDVKGNVNGEASLVKLLNGHNTLPATLEVSTPTGGRHLYFKTPKDMNIVSSISVIGDGLDVKSEGGYVVAAGSFINGEAYRITKDEEIATAPIWFTDALAKPKQAVGNLSIIHNSTIAEGRRNESLASLAGAMRRQGCDVDVIISALRARNEKDCNPPLPEGEIQTIARSVSRYEPEHIERITTQLSSPEPISQDEWISARQTPDCIVEDYLYADVACFIAPGGMGKTTLKLYEAIHIALGLPLYGLTIYKSGTVLIITAEDSREMLVARLREIAQEMQLSTTDTATVMQRVRISDVSGNGFKLTAIYGDVVMPSENLDMIIDVCHSIKPVLIVVDPAVSFGVGESRVNDAEQGLVEAARKLKRTLNCCVQFIHHSGKQNAREKAIDQYAGRGGSAFADGARMVHVMQSLTPSEWLTETGTELFNGESGLRLARPKMSYCAPVGDILIKRTGYRFDSVERSTSGKKAKQEANANQVWQLLTAELSQGRYPTQNYLEGLDTELTRGEIRSAVQWLFASQRIENRDVPNAGARGGKRIYLHPLVILNENGAPNERLAEK